MARPGPVRCGPQSFRGNDRNYVIKSYNLRLPLPLAAAAALQQLRSVPRDPDRPRNPMADVEDATEDKRTDRQTERQ